MPGTPRVPAREPAFRLLGTHFPVTLIPSVYEAMRQMRFEIEPVCWVRGSVVAVNELSDLRQVSGLSLPVCELRQ